jgi:O-antigen ligase
LQPQSIAAWKPKERLAFYGGLLGFIGINCVLFAQGTYWFALLPLMLFVLWMAVYHPYKVMLFIAFCVPLSIKYTFERFNLTLSVPTEPLLILLTGLFWVRWMIDGQYDLRIWKHPITILVVFNLLWILLTALTSSMPVVSLKFFIARMWFVSVFFFMAIPMFRHKKNIITFYWLMPLSLCVAIGYTWSRHARHLFEQSFANKAAWPLFTDHGVYSACISLILPMMLLYFWKPLVFRQKIGRQILAGGISVILAAAIVLSYARAAWIGVAVAAVMFIIFMLKIRMRTLLVAASILSVVGYLFWINIYFKLKDNTKDSDSDFRTHIESMTNISTDASNTERLNRWHSAWRMFKERPVVGWGPGTYMFQYAPFQLSSEMTIISTNMGTLGNAHSEYLGPMAESGVLGILSVVALFFVSIQQAMQLIYKSRDRFVKFSAMGVALGLITYFTHGVLNDYLDVDKAAVPFWAAMAILVALKLYYADDESGGTENVDGENL